MPPLTKRQEQVLSFIEDHKKSNSRSPTFREIQAHFGFSSPKAATDHIRAIIKKGFLKIRQGSRGLVPLRPALVETPLLGRIAAGAPIEAIENIESSMDLSSIGVDNADGNHFALRVKGDSMVNAHILNGDMVVIQKQPMVKSNEIAAVFWNNEATLKYVKRAGNNIMLVPANDAMGPIKVSPEKTSSFSILGKVVRVIRKV